jgi:hypothetical protein
VLLLLGIVEMGASISSATGAQSTDPVVIGKGHIGSRHWFVVAAPDGKKKGICFEVGVYLRTPRSGVNGGGQCSAPAPRRGILLTTDQRSLRTGLPAITVVGGAFNLAVRQVEAVSFNGSVEFLRLKLPGPTQTGGSQVGKYRFLALATPGPWCVKRLVTYDAQGTQLWTAEFDEFGRGKTYEVPSRKKGSICPRHES